MLKVKDLFPEDFDYSAYVSIHSLRQLLNDEVNSACQSTEKTTRFKSMDTTEAAPIPPDYDDLCRLHYLCRSRKVGRVLEFGVGKSTIIMTAAIDLNQKEYGNYWSNQLQTNNTHEVHSVDNYQFWIARTLDLMPERLKQTQICHFHLADVITGTFQERICTYYNPLPNVSADLIYIDGPDNLSALGDVRGISPRDPDRLPMAADLLAIEHFLEPGTLVVIDGRTANARFLAKNLQRNWSYLHIKEWDQHFFELQEEPLGLRNKSKIDFCLGQKFYSRLNIC